MTLRVAVFGAGAVGSVLRRATRRRRRRRRLIARGRAPRGAPRERPHGRRAASGRPRTGSGDGRPGRDRPGRRRPVLREVVRHGRRGRAARRRCSTTRPACSSLQNGIDNEEIIAAAVGAEHVIGGAAYILGSIVEPGVIDAAGPRRIVIGELRRRRSPRPDSAILDVAERAGLASRRSTTSGSRSGRSTRCSSRSRR